MQKINSDFVQTQVNILIDLLNNITNVVTKIKKLEHGQDFLLPFQG
jgi:hypothetical protein